MIHISEHEVVLHGPLTEQTGCDAGTFSCVATGSGSSDRLALEAAALELQNLGWDVSCLQGEWATLNPDHRPSPVAVSIRVR